MAFSPRKSHAWKSWKSVRKWSKSSCYIWHIYMKQLYLPLSMVEAYKSNT